MPVSFRDLRADDERGLAGFLRFVMEPDGRGMRAGLFLINSRGEPADFAFSRIDISAPLLWRDGGARRSATARLAVALFQACPESPAIFFTLAGDVHPKLFTEDLAVDAPVCRVLSGGSLPPAPDESIETVSGTTALIWVNAPPRSGSDARGLLDQLIARQLIVEPFERAAAGIEEAFRGG